jgi:N-acetyltransferase B complex (NatB) non catalytic subunit
MRENAFHGANDLLGDFLELLVEYFRLFGGKSCCTNDLKMFLAFLEPERRTGLATRLLQDCGISATALPKSVSSERVCVYCNGVEKNAQRLKI